VENLVVVDADRALQEVGSPKVLNLILLGAAVRSGALGLEAEDLKDAVRRLIPEKFHELNFRALDYNA
jgi:indolepyruvate ferredoxin oxidoreductase beta subunit